jgi:hypothetical protein
MTRRDFVCSAALPAAVPVPSDKSGDYSRIRGFNYQPSYHYNGCGIWLNFRTDLVDLELGRGKKYFPGINTVRLWLSVDAFAVNPKKAAQNFEAALRIANKHGLQVVATLFNNWHSLPDFGGLSLEMVRYWGDPKNNTIPLNLLAAYVEQIACAHGRDDRVLLWDLCNEPFNSGNDSEYAEWMGRVYRQCKAAGVRASLGVSVPPSLKQLELVEPISDVLMIHPYGNQKFMEGALVLGRKAGKPVIATECCWGHLDDARRAAIVEKELTALKSADIGFLAHVLHHSLVADCHRQRYGAVSTAGYMAFIEDDGSLRRHHDVFNKFT